MSAVASEITSVSIICSVGFSGADRKASKIRVTGLCEEYSAVTGGSPHKGQIARKNDVIRIESVHGTLQSQYPVLRLFEAIYSHGISYIYMWSRCDWLWSTSVVVT